jgi:Glycosyl hydrolases family 43
MYVAATRPGLRRDETRRLALARAPAPAGPFAWDAEPVVGDRWAIDAHPFGDDDGSRWLFYNTRDDTTRYLDGTIGTGNVVDRLLSPGRVEGRPRLVTVPDARWEGNRAGTFYWNEGAWVLKRRGRYWQMYSGGSFAEPGYAVGVASADRLEGPWHKDPRNPILRGSGRLRGPGHHCVVMAPDGVTPYAVYHARVPGRAGRVGCLDRLWWTGERPVIGGPAGGRGAGLPHAPTHSPQPLPPGPVHDPRIASWHAEVWVRAGAGLRRVEAAQVDSTLTVRVDDDPPERLPAVGAPSELALDGEVVDRRVTSWLACEELVVLEPGERRSWAWGGPGPVELTLAARGEATVTLGDQRARVPGGGWRHVVLVSLEGAATIDVRAGATAVEVTDLVAVARDPGWAAEAVSAPPHDALRRLARRLRGAGR